VPQLPINIWLLVAGTVLLLLALCIGTAYVVLRASTRQRIARWSARRLQGLSVAAVLPWVVVRLAPIHIALDVHGIGKLLVVLLLALLAFALLVLLPLATLLCAVVWGMAHLRR
jgi:hypothetical protein